MLAGRSDRAEALLARLVTAAPTADTSSALLDLARLARQRKAPREALSWLDALSARPDRAALAEPAAHLRCAVALDLRSSDAAACLEHYLRDFPASERRSEVAAQLVALRASAGDCARAVALASAELRRQPRGPHAAALQAWLARCHTPTR